MMIQTIWKVVNYTTGETLESDSLENLKNVIENEWNVNDLLKVFKYNNKLPSFVGSKKAFSRKYLGGLK